MFFTATDSSLDINRHSCEKKLDPYTSLVPQTLWLQGAYRLEIISTASKDSGVMPIRFCPENRQLNLAIVDWCLVVSQEIFTREYTRPF